MVRNGSGRRRLAAVLTVAALGLAAACAGDRSSPTPSPSASKTPAGPALLTVAVYGPPAVVAAYTRIASDFSAAHPETVVNVRPYDSEQAAMTALGKELDAGNPPDAFLAGLEDLPRLVQRKAVARLDDPLAERHVDFGDGFQRDALEAWSADNALQCMPVDVSPLVVYYNKRLLDLTTLTQPGERPVDAKSGWTLDQFAAAAHQVSRGTVRGLYVAPDLDQVAPFVWSGGGQIVDDKDEPTTLTLADDASQGALQKLLEVVRDPTITFNRQQLARRGPLERFRAGTLAMILGRRDLTPVLRSQQDLDFDVMPLPRIGSKATTGTSTGLCLSTATEHPNRTADFLAYAVSQEPTALLASTGYVVPTNLEVLNSDAFLQPDERPLNAAVFAESIRSVHYPPRVDTWPSVEAKTGQLLSGLFDDPVIDPLDQRLKAIDAASAPLFTPVPSPSASPSGSPSG